MNEDCENCAFWRDHYYWDHMGDEKKQFSAVAKGDFKNSIVSLPFRTLSVKFFCKFISTTVASRSASSPLFSLLGYVILRVLVGVGSTYQWLYEIIGKMKEIIDENTGVG